MKKIQPNSAIFCAMILTITGCGPGMDSRYFEYLSTSLERPLCNQNILYSQTVPLTGVAQFEKRSLTFVTENNKLSNMSLSDPLEPLPIQFAEIAVYDQYGKLVQCGKTDSDGSLKSVTGSELLIPAIAQTYFVRINARSTIDYGGVDNTLNVVVKKDIYREEVQFIEKSVESDGLSGANISLLAYARQTDSETIEGGAFNILNSVQKAYDFVKTNTPGVNTSCMSQSLSIFWQAGFNPVQYESPQTDPSTLANTSYYSKKNNQLFISGGQIGNLSLVNTDHFDDFAIIHELGHFIENHCGQWVSPGGSHALTNRIDPRLAWSEGFANYFATQVINSKMNELDPTLQSKLLNVNEINGWTFFFNSLGFSDSSQNVGNGSGFMVDFKRAGTDPGQWQQGTAYAGIDFDRVVPSSYPGEGHFREGAISRGLFKLTNSCGIYCSVSTIGFLEMWKSFDKITGFANLTNPFSGSHDFFENLKSRLGVAFTSDHVTSLNTDALNLRSEGTYFVSGVTNWVPYGHRLTQSGVACPLKIQPRPDDSSLTGGTSDPRYSNHFYTIDLLNPSLANLDSITITFTKIAGSNVDHDILVFEPGYIFNDDYKCSGTVSSNGSCSVSFNPQRTTNENVVLYNRNVSTNLGTTYAKTISGLNTLDKSKFYLLDLRSYTATSTPSTLTEYTYTITSNLGALCPL